MLKFLRRSPFIYLISFLFLFNCSNEKSNDPYQDPGVLQRSLSNLPTIVTEISSETAHYKPMFGAGDENSTIVNSIKRSGYLSIDPQGSSSTVNYGREEIVYYVLNGTGQLHYNEQVIPISKDDFFYMPIEVEHSFSNNRESSLNLFVFGYEIPIETDRELISELKIANGGDVPWIILDSHGPSVTYQLLMGTTESTRDRLATAYQVRSLFTMDFLPEGTNKPHRHANQEEIYIMLQGHGDMVTGESPDGEEILTPVVTGDAFFFSKNTLVGFYSRTELGEKNARILAIRHNY